MAPMLKRRMEDDSPTRIVKKPKKSGEDDLYKDISKSRREVRKTMRTLKKMRKDAFMRKKAVCHLNYFCRN